MKASRDLYGMSSLGTSLDFFEDVKVVLVGDSRVGKSALLSRNLWDKFSENYNRTSSPEKRSWTQTVSNKEVYFTLWDTPGGGGSNKVNPLLYTKADVVLLCFKITEPKTLASAFNRWTMDIRNFAPDVPIILVGCQSDLRSNKEIIAGLAAQGQAPISSEQGLTVSHQIRSILYVETSSKTCLRSAVSAFEIAALTAMGQFSQSPNFFSKTARISPQFHVPLLPPKSKHTRSPPLPPKPPVRRAISSVALNKENLYTPEPASAKSLMQLHVPGDNPSFRTVSREKSALNLSGCRTPKIPPKESEKTVTIRCQRLTSDKRREEVDLEVPAPIYETLRFYNQSSDDLLRDYGEKRRSQSIKKSFRAKIKQLFAVKI